MNQTSFAAAHAPVDLRSDTVTHPTATMYERMRTAPIGDDGLDGDPTVRELEAYVAAQLGKEGGLFVPSCTMANLLAVLAQTQRNEQVVLESAAHMYTSERGAATFTGSFYLGLPGSDGAMDLNRLEDALLAGGHRLKTALVTMETSHNNAAGAVLPLDHMQAVHGLAKVLQHPAPVQPKATQRHRDIAILMRDRMKQPVAEFDIAVAAMRPEGIPRVSDYIEVARFALSRDAGTQTERGQA